MVQPEKALSPMTVSVFKSTDPKEIQTKVNETVNACINTLKVHDFAWQNHFKEVIADVNATQEELRKQAANAPKN